MIHLPDLLIERNEFKEVNLFLKTKAWLKKKDTLRVDGIHVSDLLDPLYAFWQKKFPHEPTERMVWFWSIGQVLHLLVLNAFNETDSIATDEGSQEALGIHYSTDASSKEGNPIELKSHRGQKEPSPERLQSDFSHYLEQLCCYMVLKKRLQGELWVLFLNLQDAAGRTFPEPRVYDVTLTKEQFQEIYEQIIETRDELHKALETDNPSSLRICRPWKCSTNCIYWGKQCKPEGRWPQKDRRKWLV